MRVTYGPDGQIYEAREPFRRFHQPTNPILAEIIRLTGITDEKVAGQTTSMTSTGQSTIASPRLNSSRHP